MFMLISVKFFGLFVTLFYIGKSVNLKSASVLTTMQYHYVSCVSTSKVSAWSDPDPRLL